MQQAKVWVQMKISFRSMGWQDEGDEGFEDGEDTDVEEGFGLKRRSSSRAKGKERARRASSEQDPLHPQQAVKKVLAELEDDFTHYKR